MKQIVITKRLKNYLNQLFILGLFYYIAGIVVSYVLFSSTSEIPLIYLPLIIFVAVLAYLGVMKVDPGGTVTYYFTPHKNNEEEKSLYELVTHFRNKVLTSIIIGIYIISVIVMLLNNYNKKVVLSFDLFITVVGLVLVAIVCIGNGAKYTSAWWNIKRNTKNGIIKLQ